MIINLLKLKVMKKRDLKSLRFNKKLISNLTDNRLKGGTGNNSALCTGLAGSCWCNVTVTDCPPCPGDR